MKEILASWFASISGVARRPRRPVGVRPCLEALEDRLPPAALGWGGGVEYGPSMESFGGPQRGFTDDSI